MIQEAEEEYPGLLHWRSFPDLHLQNAVASNRDGKKIEKDNVALKWHVNNYMQLKAVIVENPKLTLR